MSAIIAPARFPEDAPIVRRLFRAYAEWLGQDLSFQGFEEELAALPGKYAQPDGIVLLMRDESDDQVLGCIAMRRQSGNSCEMKRLYLTDAARGKGQGRALVEALIEHARAVGYRHMVLDTLGHMNGAVRLYERTGFQPVAPYYNNPLPGVVYLGREL